MKKFMSALLVVCLLFTGGISIFQLKSRPAQNMVITADAANPEEAAVAERVNLAAIYASHDPSEIIGTCDGRDVTWGEYFYYYNGYVADIENYMSTMKMYGLELSWSDLYDEDTGITYAQLPSQLVPEEIRQYGAIEGYAAKAGIALTEENTERVQEQLNSIKANYVGEDATDEMLEAFLMESYLPLNLYRRLLSSNYLYQQTFTEKYGENGKNISDQEAMAYLEDGDYLTATHILFMTIDPATREALDEETIAKKLESATKIVEELAAIEDSAARLARFNELKAEFDEDTGKTVYPDGYTFTSGKMVEEFENASRALKDYEVSEPVESTYGYHVIMRLPLDPDAVIEYSSNGTPMTARSELANAQYGEELQAYFEGMTIDFAEGFEAPVVTDYID